MNRKSLLPLLTLMGLIAVQAIAQISTPPSGNNQRSIVKQYIGSVVWVKIDYRSPDVDGRDGKIWGQLVPYGLNSLGFGASTADNPSPWRAGANENTTIEFSHDVQVQGKDLAAGKYGLHMIPEESGPWTIIFTNESGAWGSFYYNPSQDALRVEATPEDADHQEWLTYEFVDRQPDAATVALLWEKKKIPFTISVPKNNEYIKAKLENELLGVNGFNYLNWVGASNWASNAGFHDTAIQWAENAITAPFVGQRDYTSLSNKATVLGRAEKSAEADAAMDEALNHATATALQIHGYGRGLIARDRKEKALEVFQLNYKKFKGAWPTNYGLARGYSAVGNHKQALKYLKIALKNVPEGDTVNPPLIEANIKKLEKGEDIN
ncbi:MAG: DUF2911 domain-containing protein [Cyclobacteriaceae bacterium]|nr:DUF2911 domain-containing protein [Cyclobacteriaceae bacterium HetDA_MAG_MS6]